MADLGSLLGGLGGSAIGQAVVRLELDTGKYNAEMKATQAQTTASANAMGGSTSKFAGLAKAAFLGVGVAAVAGIGFAIKAGSDLNEQLNRSRVIFGAASRSVIAFSETAASSLGIAQAETLEAAGNFGQLFDAAGFAGDAAAEMSLKMTTLSADLGSFNNIPVAEALEKIRGGLSGEAEPLRVLGVFLSEAAVQAEAFSSGIAEAGTELTDAQKIQARYNIILDQTTNAQGDFARTVGESLPNQLKVFKAELTDVAADLGIVLLPIVLDVVKAFKVLVPVLKFVADNLDLVVGALTVFATMKYLPGWINALGTSFQLSAVSAGLAAAAVTLLVIGLQDMASTVPRADEGLQRMVNHTLKQFAEESYASDRALIQFAADMLIASDNALTSQSSLSATQLAVHGLREEFTKGTITQDEFGSALRILGLEQDDVTRIIKETTNAADGFTHHIDKAGKSVRNFAHMTNEELKDWRSTVKASIETAIFALEDLSTDSGITRRDVIGAFQMMADEAANFNRALKVISKEKWVNDEFVKFLVEQGPEWLTAFTELNEKEQRAAQAAWQETTKKTDAAKDSLDKITGVLKDLDGKTSKHTVIIDYRYEGFDPTKPGMSAQQR